MTVRTILAIVVLAAVLWITGVQELWAALCELELQYVVYLLLLAVVMIWISCVKWQLFIRAAGHQASIISLMKFYTMGYFYNTFIPSYVGGDVARSYHLGKDLNNQKDAFVSTFLERFTGLLAMSLLGVCFVAVGTQATAGVEVAVLIVGAGAIAIALICFSPLIGALFFALLPRLIVPFCPEAKAEKLKRLIAKLNDAMATARSSPVLFLRAMFYSFLFHVLTVINTYVAAKAVGWENPDFAGLFVVVPLVLLVGMAPITPAGLGIQEGAFLFFLQRVGGSKGQSLGVGVVLRAKVMLIAVVGWLLWVGMKREANIEDNS